MTLKDLLGDAFKEGMTAEEINQALLGVNLNGDQAEIMKLRGQLSKANGEAAQYRRDLGAQKAAVEKNENDWQAKYAQLEERLNAAERDRNIGQHTASLVALGYTAELASETATAIVDGDVVKMLANQKAFLAAHDKKVLEDNMRSTPRPAAGGGAGAVVDWNKSINDAMASGDMARAAALMRQQQEAMRQT